MAAHIQKSRAPFRAKLEAPLAVTESLLYRRGNFGGTFDQLIIDAMLAVLDAEIALSPGFRWGGVLLPGDTITFEHLMDQTAITYPGAFVSRHSGTDIKTILEDVADNLFHPDPYYQQGGDMVRVGGLAYTLDVNGAYGRRILDVTVRGKPLDARKRYRVAHWASVQPPLQTQRPIWDVVADYLRRYKTVRVDSPYTPALKGTDGNPGLRA
jgi:sulfur-oxidizing protein SoxB